MTDTLVLPGRAAVDALRAALARERTVLEVRRCGGESVWRAVDTAEPFDWDAPAPLAGVKAFFFPARERLLTWEAEAVAETLPAVAPVAFVGLRACDLAAVAVQDRFFADDPWYRRRRAQVLLVGVNCLRACPGGFCVDFDAGPFARRGFDLALTPLPDGRVVLEIGSAAGRSAVAAAGLSGSPPDAGARVAFAVAEAAATASFPSRPFVARALARVDAHGPRAIADAEWQALGPACFACTGCTSLCPTCTCFTVVDEARGTGGERVRVWDSCLLEGFQREASGHHPAPRPGDRVRRFWSHKLSAAFTPDLGRLGCVGCGRCDVACPGAIGALAVLGALGAG
jgi:sulfhydrogenase subunit beta (sulfur reductase)